MSEHRYLKIEQEGGVRVLSLARPEKRNAIHVGLSTELANAVRAATADEGVRVVVVTGQGDYFTAGVDVNLFLGGADVGQVEGAVPPTEIHLPLYECHKPLVAAVNGPAVGMGVTLLPYFDMVYAADTATFTTPFVKLALVQEFGSSFTLTRLLGRQRASELILRGAPIDAATALAWGLVTRVFPRADFHTEVSKITQELALHPVGSLRACKALLRKGEASNDLMATLAEEHEVLLGRYGSDENIEAVTAFLQKRRT